MTPTEFTAIGQHLFGPSWKRPLSVALAIHERTVTRYTREENPVPLPVRRRLRDLLVQHSAQSVELRRAINLSA